MSACGCRQCGGPIARADTLLARRVIARADYIAHIRGATLRDRRAPLDLYTRLVYAAVRRAEG